MLTEADFQFEIDGLRKEVSADTKKCAQAQPVVNHLRL